MGLIGLILSFDEPKKIYPSLKPTTRHNKNTRVYCNNVCFVIFKEIFSHNRELWHSIINIILQTSLCNFDIMVIRLFIIFFKKKPFDVVLCQNIGHEKFIKMTRESAGPLTPTPLSRLSPPPETSVHETLRKTAGEHVSCSGINHFNMNLQHVL